jgi:hypothetical protein
MLKRLCIFLLLLFVNCFEYEEKVFFKKNFSGHIEISYVVPLKKDGKTSLLKFLPTEEKDILQRINKGIFSHDNHIKNYLFQLLDDPEKPHSILPAHKRARVSYSIDFEKPEELENVMLGSFFAQKKGNSLTIRREFKSVAPKQGEEPTTMGEKKLASEILRLLGDNQIYFHVYFPPDADCKSDRGFIYNSVLSYQLHLSETIEKPGNKTWQYRVFYSK